MDHKVMKKLEVVSFANFLMQSDWTSDINKPRAADNAKRELTQQQAEMQLQTPL
jgi:hypothetical protein